MDNKSFAILFLSIVVSAMGYILFSKGNSNSELELYKKAHEKEIEERKSKYSLDSIALVLKYDSLLKQKDSSLNLASQEIIKQTKIIYSYAKKYKQIQAAPISVIDTQLDSLLSGHN